MYHASLTWKEFQTAASQNIAVLLPLGSTEQHGSIGPLGTDFVIPEELAHVVESHFPDRIDVLPTLPYGVCPYHTEFAGTINIGAETLVSLLSHIACDLMHHGVRRFIFLNGHGGNGPSIEQACFNIYKNGGLGAILDWWTIARELNPLWGGGHGGAQEASVMLAVRPDWVDRDKNFVPEETYHLSPLFRSTYGNLTSFGNASVKIIRSTDAFSATGTFGGTNDSCAHANQERGREIFNGTAQYLTDFTAEFLAIPTSSLPESKK